jgi:hypothetical protein
MGSKLRKQQNFNKLSDSDYGFEIDNEGFLFNFIYKKRSFQDF